jgi:hypothetical protein
MVDFLVLLRRYQMKEEKLTAIWPKFPRPVAFDLGFPSPDKLKSYTVPETSETNK